MIALYRPGSSPLHRMPAGWKLTTLAVLALIASLWPHTIWTAIGALGGAFLLFLVGGQGPMVFVRQLWAAKWIVLILVVTQILFVSWDAAVTVSARVVAVVLMAGLVTLTTRMSELLDALERAMGPLRVFRVDPARVAFVLSLTIAAIPVIASLAHQVDEAHRARGVRPGPRAIVTLLVLALRHADDLGDAITARAAAAEMRTY
ncbi:energy-coupling factor transporter transmembrane component T family protein [Microbacterium halotolerans]|uniref:energy-coupling factor transporter transmembrane component T family protein n=1 Tax=Microbacterium halotolerans TaxID=246613 RepID=UPI000E6AD623|nr:energy-coupling factor transporter transmembrane protein EcfT [Microbacterium halotolerans]